MTSIALVAQNQGLNAGGWIMMTGCIMLVFCLCAFCIWRILREPAPSVRDNAPLDIDTHDHDG